MPEKPEATARWWPPVSENCMATLFWRERIELGSEDVKWPKDEASCRARAAHVGARRKDKKEGVMR